MPPCAWCPFHAHGTIFGLNERSRSFPGGMWRVTHEGAMTPDGGAQVPFASPTSTMSTAGEPSRNLASPFSPSQASSSRRARVPSVDQMALKSAATRERNSAASTVRTPRARKTGTTTAVRPSVSFVARLSKSTASGTTAVTTSLLSPMARAPSRTASESLTAPPNASQISLSITAARAGGVSGRRFRFHAITRMRSESGRSALSLAIANATTESRSSLVTLQNPTATCPRSEELSATGRG